MKAFRYMSLLGFVLLAGCVTDKLVVFEDALLSDDEMKPFLGKWELIECKSLKGEDQKFDKGILTMEKKGARYRFLLEVVADKKDVGGRAGYFLLSKIPNSRSGLLLFSCPKLVDLEEVPNSFGIMKKDKGKIYFWMVLDDHPVAEGHLSVANHAFKSTDVKSFLEEYADAYVLANAPVYTFKKK